MVGRRRAAREVGVSEDRVAEWTRLGVMPAHRDPLTGRIRYSLPAIREWLRTAGMENLDRRAS